ncbi:MAG: response regulator, partial [Pseudomonadota bacterium]
MTARVLVVDDLEPNVKLLEAKLRAEYFDVLGVFSGRDAIETARSEQPDIILLDVMMPGMDGFETCRALKSMPETMHSPVVMVTALDQQADRIAGLEAGADDFLTKPVE